MEAPGFLKGAFRVTSSTSRKVLDMRSGIIANPAGPFEYVLLYVADVLATSSLSFRKRLTSEFAEDSLVVLQVVGVACTGRSSGVGPGWADVGGRSRDGLRSGHLAGGAAIAHSRGFLSRLLLRKSLAMRPLAHSWRVA